MGRTRTGFSAGLGPAFDVGEKVSSALGEDAARQFPGHRGEALDELIEGVVVFQIVEEGSYRNPTAAKDRSSPENLWVDSDEIRRAHGVEHTGGTFAK